MSSLKSRNILESNLASRMRGLGFMERIDIAASVLRDLGPRFSRAAMETLRLHLGRPAAPAEQSALRRLCESPDFDGVNQSWLRATIFSDAASSEASAAWQQFFSQTAERDPLDLLSWARALVAQGHATEALRPLRRALSQTVDHSFFARAEKLIDALSAKQGDALRQCKIAILATSTTALLLPVLRALCLRDRIAASFYEGLYGSQRQEILDSESGLTRFQPDIAVLPWTWRDLNLPASTPEPDAFVDRLLEERRMLWEQLSSRFGCHVVQFAAGFPEEEPYGYLASALPGGRIRVIELLNRRMLAKAPNFVSVLDIPELQRETGRAAWSQPREWFSYRQYPSTTALPALAEAILAHVRAVLGLTRKVLVTDLDNTLWKGVIGEDGIEGIEIGPGTPAGEAHLALQEYLRDLKHRGILLAVCSKNNPDDARLPFEKHPHMALRLEDFATFRANWEDKVSNLRQIAADLNLGIDSFVFLDDNPLEREWVQSQIPEIAVVDLGPSVFHYVPALDRSRYFHALKLSQEDLARAEQYRSQAVREGLRAAYSSVDEFLEQLQLEAAAVPITDRNLARVTQLINKTNQFNLTTRRYTESQVVQIAHDPNNWAMAFEMSDRLGSYGLIGVLFCKPGEHARQWEIDTWLMSCRTLGRQMEKFMFDRVVEAAIERDVEEIIGVFRPTAKNALVNSLYEKTGFEKISESETESRFRFAVPGELTVTATHVRNARASATAA